MSDTGRDARNFPDLTLPSPEETVEAAPARGRRLSGGLIRAGLFTALVLSLIFAGRCALSGSEAGRMKVSGLSPGESDLKGVSAETSPEYKRRLDDYSARRGSEAIEKGGTFVAPASGVGKPVPAEPFEAPRVTREPPQAADMGIHRTGVAFKLIAPNRSEQFLARADASGGAPGKGRSDRDFVSRRPQERSRPAGGHGAEPSLSPD